MTVQREEPTVSPGALPSRPPRRGRREIVPVTHYGRGVLIVVVIAVVAGLVSAFANNPNIDWSVVGKYFLNGSILRGLGSTLIMTVVSMVFAVVLAVVIAVMRMSESKIVSGVATGYVFVFRGIPLIVLLIFVGNLGLFMKTVSIGIPFTDIVFFEAPTGSVVTPFIASIIALSLAGSGYMAEIVRSGLLSVGRGQREAAKALGLTSNGALRYIVLPQALRIILPPLGNEFIGMMKATAIVSIIAGGDMLTVVMGISGITYRTIELLIVATLWYLIAIAIFSAVQYFIERKTAEK